MILSLFDFQEKSLIEFFCSAQVQVFIFIFKCFYCMFQDLSVANNIRTCHCHICFSFYKDNKGGVRSRLQGKKRTEMVQNHYFNQILTILI